MSAPAFVPARDDAADESNGAGAVGPPAPAPAPADDAANEAKGAGPPLQPTPAPVPQVRTGNIRVQPPSAAFKHGILEFESSKSTCRYLIVPKECEDPLQIMQVACQTWNLTLPSLIVNCDGGHDAHDEWFDYLRDQDSWSEVTQGSNAREVYKSSLSSIFQGTMQACNECDAWLWTHTCEYGWAGPEAFGRARLAAAREVKDYRVLQWGGNQLDNNDIFGMEELRKCAVPCDGTEPEQRVFYPSRRDEFYENTGKDGAETFKRGPWHHLSSKEANDKGIIHPSNVLCGYVTNLLIMDHGSRLFRNDAFLDPRSDVDGAGGVHVCGGDGTRHPVVVRMGATVPLHFLSPFGWCGRHLLGGGSIGTVAQTLHSRALPTLTIQSTRPSLSTPCRNLGLWGPWHARYSAADCTSRRSQSRTTFHRVGASPEGGRAADQAADSEGRTDIPRDTPICQAGPPTKAWDGMARLMPTRWFEPGRADPELSDQEKAKKLRDRKHVRGSFTLPVGYTDSHVIIVDARNDSTEYVVDKLIQCMSRIDDDESRSLGFAQLDSARLRRAWEMVLVYNGNASRQRRIADACEYVAIVVFLVTAVVATCYSYFKTAESKGDASGAALEGLRWGISALPLLTTFVLSVQSRFSPMTKWRQLKAAAARTESEIYLYRTRVSVYAPQQSRDRKEKTRELLRISDSMSDGTRKKQADRTAGGSGGDSGGGTAAAAEEDADEAVKRKPVTSHCSYHSEQHAVRVAMSMSMSMLSHHEILPPCHYPNAIAAERPLCCDRAWALVHGEASSLRPSMRSSQRC